MELNVTSRYGLLLKRLFYLTLIPIILAAMSGSAVLFSTASASSRIDCEIFYYFKATISDTSLRGWPLISGWAGEGFKTVEVDVIESIDDKGSLSINSKAASRFSFIFNSAQEPKIECNSGEILKTSLGPNQWELDLIPQYIDFSYFNLIESVANFGPQSFESLILFALEFLKLQINVLLVLLIFFPVYVLLYRGNIHILGLAASAFLSSSIYGFLHYFFTGVNALFIYIVLNFCFIFLAAKKYPLQFLLNQTKTYMYDSRRLFIFLYPAFIFYKIIDYFGIGGYLTDVHHYAQSMPELAKFQLLNTPDLFTGNGFRSADYSQRTLFYLLNLDRDVEQSLIVWMLFYISVTLLAVTQVLKQNKIERIVALLVQLIVLLSLLSQWNEGYFTKFSALSTWILALLSLSLFMSVDNKVFYYLFATFAAFSSSIQPYTAIAFLPILIFLAFKNRAYKSVNYYGFVAYFVGTFLLTAIWMRDIFISVSYTSESGGINLNNIGRYIIFPHSESLRYLGQVIGALPWHAPGIRNPASDEVAVQLNLFDLYSMKLTDLFVVLFIISIICFVFPRFRQLRNHKMILLLLMLVFLLAQILAQYLLRDISFYIFLSSVTFLGPIAVISILILFGSDSLNSSEIQARHISKYKLVSQRLAVLSLFIMISITSLSIVREIYAFLPRPNYVTVKDSYLSYGVQARQAERFMNGGKYLITPGQYSSAYEARIASSILLMSTNFIDCINCAYAKGNNVEILDKSLLQTFSKPDFEIVLFGDCSGLTTERIFGNFSICKRT